MTPATPERRSGLDHAAGPGWDRFQPRRHDGRSGRQGQGPRLLRV